MSIICYIKLKFKCLKKIMPWKITTACERCFIQPTFNFRFLTGLRYFQDWPPEKIVLTTIANFYMTAKLSSSFHITIADVFQIKTCGDLEDALSNTQLWHFHLHSGSAGSAAARAVNSALSTKPEEQIVLLPWAPPCPKYHSPLGFSGSKSHLASL